MTTTARCGGCHSCNGCRFNQKTLPVPEQVRRDERKAAVMVVHRLMENNPFPWHEFDAGFRFKVLRSCVTGYREATAYFFPRCELKRARPAQPVHIPHHLVMETNHERETERQHC